MPEYERLLKEGWEPTKDQVLNDGFVFLKKDDKVIIFNKTKDSFSVFNNYTPESYLMT